MSIRTRAPADDNDDFGIRLIFDFAHRRCNRFACLFVELSRHGRRQSSITGERAMRIRSQYKPRKRMGRSRPLAPPADARGTDVPSQLAPLVNKTAPQTCCAVT